MQQPLTGAVALVTGASSGIGEATARGLVSLGGSVAAVARRRDRLDRLANKLPDGRCLTVQADISDRAQVDAAVDEVVSVFGRLDIVVNNAGIALRGRVDETPASDWERLLAVNLQGTIHVTQSALPHLTAAARDSPRGVADVVNISSTAARAAHAELAFYTLAKYGLTAFSEVLRQEVVQGQVRVSVVVPGSVATEIYDDVTDETFLQQVAAIEQLCPEDISDAVCYVVTRDRRVAVNEMVVRAREQPW